MRSLLTRRVFRLILHNELHSCMRCLVPPTIYCLHSQRTPTLPNIPKRTLFGFSRKRKRQPKPINYEPGLEKMLELKARLSRGERTPPPEELAQAFVDFFQSKQRNRSLVEDIQAHNALMTFEHLQNTQNDMEGIWLTGEELRMALGALRLSQDCHSKSHNKLARLLFGELQRRREAATDNKEDVVPLEKDLVPFIRVLSHSGDAIYARDMIEKHWGNETRLGASLPWSSVLRGLTWERRGEEIQRTLQIMEKRNVPFDNKSHQVITVYYAQVQGDMDKTKKWFQHPIAFGQSPTEYTNKAVLQLCIKGKEFEWGDTIFKSMLERDPEDEKSWNIIFQWAAAKSKSVDEIERMMQIMVRQGEEKGVELRPNINAINGLIELANARNDPYTAERYVALGQKWGFHPNARTYLLQMEYRIKVGDLGGARTAYAHLQGEEIPEDEDLPLINKLLVALATDKRQDYDAIMGLVEDLSERKARFEAETVGALAQIHLERGEMDDLVDLLNTHAFQYGNEQRTAIRDILLQQCLDPATPTPRAWETYNVLRQTFTETDIPTRTTLMKNFFSRKRSDMATHVFGHMRQQQIKSLRPTVSTYAQCLSGIARAGDVESLQTVHNMIKLDSGIELNTQLYNALMLAYSQCGKSGHALSYWDDIVHSREGPSYASIQIALRACEKAPFGEGVAQEIWGKLKKFEIEVTREIYAAYVGAFAGHNLFDKCVKLIDDAEKEVGNKPDALLYVSPVYRFSSAH